MCLLLRCASGRLSYSSQRRVNNRRHGSIVPLIPTTLHSPSLGLLPCRGVLSEALWLARLTELSSLVVPLTCPWDAARAFPGLSSGKLVLWWIYSVLFPCAGCLTCVCF